MYLRRTQDNRWWATGILLLGLKFTQLMTASKTSFSFLILRAPLSRIGLSLIEWVKLINKLINKWMNERKNEWMDGWMDGLAFHQNLTVSDHSIIIININIIIIIISIIIFIITIIITATTKISSTYRMAAAWSELSDTRQRNYQRSCWRHPPLVWSRCCWQRWSRTRRRCWCWGCCT